MNKNYKSEVPPPRHSDVRLAWGGWARRIWLRQRRPQLVSRAPHSTRPRSSARDDDSSGLERLQTPGHLLREGGVSVASSQSMARRATPQASRSNVDFVWPASRPRLTERDGDDEAAGSADVMGTRRLTLECRNGTSRRSRESRVGGSSFSTPGVVSSAGAF